MKPSSEVGLQRPPQRSRVSNALDAIPEKILDDKATRWNEDNRTLEFRLGERGGVKFQTGTRYPAADGSLGGPSQSKVRQ